MYSAPPTTGFIILSAICILLLATIPVVALTIYDRTEVTSPQADTVGDAKINAQNSKP